MATQVARRSASGKRILDLEKDTAFYGVPRHGWVRHHGSVDGFRLYSGVATNFPPEEQENWVRGLGWIAREELEKLCSRGFVRPSQVTGRRLQGTSAHQFVRTDMPQVYRVPKPTSAWPYTIDQHWKLYTTCAWEQHREWMRKLAGHRAELPKLTKTQLIWFRQFLEAEARGKTARRWVPDGHCWMLYLPTGMEYLLYTMLVVPEFSEGSFVRFAPIDQEMAKQKLLSLVTTSPRESLQDVASSYQQFLRIKNVLSSS